VVIVGPPPSLLLFGLVGNVVSATLRLVSVVPPIVPPVVPPVVPPATVGLVELLGPFVNFLQFLVVSLVQIF